MIPSRFPGFSQAGTRIDTVWFLKKNGQGPFAAPDVLGHSRQRSAPVSAAKTQFNNATRGWLGGAPGLFHRVC